MLWYGIYVLQRSIQCYADELLKMLKTLREIQTLYLLYYMRDLHVRRRNEGDIKSFVHSMRGRAVLSIV